MIQSKWRTVTATVCGVLAVASPADRRAETDLYLRYGSDESAGGIAWQCFPDTVDPRGPKVK